MSKEPPVGPEDGYESGRLEDADSVAERLPPLSASQIAQVIRWAWREYKTDQHGRRVSVKGKQT